MFVRASKHLAQRVFPQKTHCDDGSNDDDSTPSLVEQADAAIESQKERIRTPNQFEHLRGTLGQGSVNTFDGFRVHVQKQVNLNTVVSHFYWVGSQQTGQPIYQYRLILPFDDKVVNVATDMDFNVEGEVKGPLSFLGKNINAKSNFVIGEQANNISVDVDMVDDSSATQFHFAKGTQSTLGVNYMQALLPCLVLGGSGQYNLGKGQLRTAIGGIYDRGENLVAAQWDNEFRILFLRRVNPNRVNVSTELTVDESGNSQVSVGAEYTLKQSKLHMSLDSNLVAKSSVETTLAPGMTMQLCAEIAQAAQTYRFGFGVSMG